MYIGTSKIVQKHLEIKKLLFYICVEWKKRFERFGLRFTRYCMGLDD